MIPIDYVIPFVDSSDREWVGTYRKYAPTDCSWSSNATRFREEEEIWHKSLATGCYFIKNGRISKKSGPQMLQHAFFV